LSRDRFMTCRSGLAAGRVVRAGAGQLLLCVLGSGAAFAQAPDSRCPYAWRTSCETADRLASRLPPPPGCQRETEAPQSFGEWLRGLPLLRGRPRVLLFDGRPKVNQEAHVAVIDIDVGTRDLQQCADAVIRLRTEYLFALGRLRAIRFSLTNGDVVDFERWSRGLRPTVRGGRVAWSRSAAPDASHVSLRHYLDFVFTYAGSRSLARDLGTAVIGDNVRAGDVFVKAGSPGHAVLVLDTARDARTGRRVFLLAQSYMPAQQIHVLKNPSEPALSPWYSESFGSTLVTPEWTFKKTDLRRFSDDEPSRGLAGPLPAHPCQASDRGTGPGSDRTPVGGRGRPCGRER
jgi:hypothetical protein